MVQILDGKALAEELMLVLQEKVSKMKTKPRLAIIQIGSLGESNTYISKKKDFAKEIGVFVVHKKYNPNVEERVVVDDIEAYNADLSITGIMMQLPIPSHLNTSRILDAIDPKKDVDGLTSTSIKKLREGKKGFLPAVTRAVLELLRHYKIRVSKKKVVVIGDSPWVGRPTALAFSNLGASVVVCNKDTKNLKAEAKSADILISAVGRPRLISADHVSQGQVVVDIGTTLKVSKVFGDVDFDSVKNIISAITPVPGGVGPMTVLSLFENLLEAGESQTRRNK